MKGKKNIERKKLYLKTNNMRFAQWRNPQPHTHISGWFIVSYCYSVFDVKWCVKYVVAYALKVKKDDCNVDLHFNRFFVYSVRLQYKCKMQILSRFAKT